MFLTKPKQQLRRDLKEAAVTLKWADVDLLGVANRMLAAGDEQGANELMKIAFSFQETEDRLVGDAEDNRSGLLLGRRHNNHA